MEASLTASWLMRSTTTGAISRHGTARHMPFPLEKSTGTINLICLHLTGRSKSFVWAFTNLPSLTPKSNLTRNSGSQQIIILQFFSTRIVTCQ